MKSQYVALSTSLLFSVFLFQWCICVLAIFLIFFGGQNASSVSFGCFSTLVDECMMFLKVIYPYQYISCLQIVLIFKFNWWRISFSYDLNSSWLVSAWKNCVHRSCNHFKVNMKSIEAIYCQRSWVKEDSLGWKSKLIRHKCRSTLTNWYCEIQWLTLFSCCTN